MKPAFFDSVMTDSDAEPLHTWVMVCPACAERYSLATDDSCCGGNICHVHGCRNETSLVHTIFDYREIESLLMDDKRF